MQHPPTSSASGLRARRGIKLERSPFEPGVMVRGAVAGLVLAGLFLAVGFPLTAATPMEADVDGLLRVNVYGVDWLVTTARLVSQAGHLALVVGIAVLVALWARWRWKTWDLGLLIFVVLSGSQAVTALVKLLTSRDRPDDALVSTLSSAFPSGHAVRAATVYGLVAWLVLLVVRRRWLRVTIAGLAVIAILGSALARVALVAHWPTDVVAGVIVGTTWLVISLQLVRPQLVHLPTPESCVADLEEPEATAGHASERGGSAVGTAEAGSGSVHSDRSGSA
jgi:membrane-associated phospholipid phosphatase